MEPSERRSPREHARVYGVPPDIHAAASALHGWAQHEHHAGEPIMLTASAYLDAVGAAADGAPPAMAALSPHVHRRL